MKNLDLMLAQLGPEAPIDASSDTLSLVVVGFIFVMTVLAVLSAVTTIVGLGFIRRAAKDAARAAAAAERAAAPVPAVAAAPAVPAPAVPAAAAVSAPPSAEPNQGEDPVLVAVLAAAVHSVIGDRAHRIVSIRTGGPGWAQEGRREIFSSHRVR